MFFCPKNGHFELKQVWIQLCNSCSVNHSHFSQRKFSQSSNTLFQGKFKWKKELGGIQKVCSLKISKFWPPSPSPSLFFLHVLSLSTSVYYSELVPLKKSSAMFMNFQMKNQGVKRQKNYFFCKLNIKVLFLTLFLHCFLHWLYIQWQKYLQFMKNVKLKKCLHLFNKKAPLCAGG